MAHSEASKMLRALRARGRRSGYAALAALMFGTIFTMSGGTASAGTGGLFTFLRDDRSYWNASIANAGYGEQPFVIDTNGDRRQELATYHNGLMTIRRDDGSVWTTVFANGGYGETPLAVNRTGGPGSHQQAAVYYNGRFTWRNDNGTYGGVTMPGAGKIELPLAVDTNGDGRQEFATYRNGTFTFLRDDGTTWQVGFAGASASDVPFIIDTDGNGKQELAVYRDSRLTIRRDDGSYWGFNFIGGGPDDVPLGVDTDGNGRQEFTLYNHAPIQLLAKQIMADTSIDSTSGRAVREDLQQAADGVPSNNGYRMAGSILRAIVRAGYNHNITISSLTGNGSGHSSTSRHYSGAGFDLNWIDGYNSNNNDANTRLTGRDVKSINVINDIKDKLPTNGARIGQLGCAGTPATLPSWISQITDTCNHLHVDVPVGTE